MKIKLSRADRMLLTCLIGLFALGGLLTLPSQGSANYEVKHADATFSNHTVGCSYNETSIRIANDRSVSGSIWLGATDQTCAQPPMHPTYKWEAKPGELQVELKSPNHASVKGTIHMTSDTGEIVQAHIHAVWTDEIRPQHILTYNLGRHGLFQHWKKASGDQVTCYGSITIEGHPEISYVALTQGWCTLPYEKGYGTWAWPWVNHP